MEPASQWPVNTPDSLSDLCIEFCASNLEKLVCNIVEDGLYDIKPNISLPPSIIEALLSACAPLTRQYIGMLRDPLVVNVRRVDLKSISDLTDDDLRWTLAHRPTELHFSCSQLTQKSLKAISECGENLQALCIYNCVDFLADNFSGSHSDDDGDGIMSDERRNALTQNMILRCPKLRRLSVYEASTGSSNLLSMCISKLPLLTRLDLCNCIFQIGDLSNGLSCLHSLQMLSLHNVPIGPDLQIFEAVSQCRSLRFLDLGQSDSGDPVRYDGVEDRMPSLMSCLPLLTWLEIGGTNLAGFLPVVSRRISASTSARIEDEQCPIPGLQDRTLDYLGLLNCAHHACERQNLPAKRVSGSANERQIIQAVHSYVDRQLLLNMSLNNLFRWFKHNECHDHYRALEGILAAMKRHLHDRSIQISGSASLFYIVKGSNKHLFSTKLKQTVIKTLICSLENHLSEPTILRNCCLTMCHFRIPHDIVHTYERLVTILLRVIQSTSSPEDDFVQRITVYLLNSLSCQVDNKEKQLIGKLGVFSVILELIRCRMEDRVCDEVMEVAWSMLWNATDETADNCQMFIDGNGMDVFVNCFEMFKDDHEELLRNMMGLLGNVAEVAFLRPHLMNHLYISIFRDQLFSVSNGIEVSYNACGVLAHMVSDGPEAWTVDTPSRSLVLVDICSAIGRWKLNSKRNINYRSFKPILRLLPCFETPAVQYWAIWALCNLTKVYRAKYCPLLEREGGVEMLDEFCRDRRRYPHGEVKELAQQVIERCRRFREDSNCVSDAESE